MPRRLRIFVSSPGDVPEERLRTDLIVDKLSQEYGRFFTIVSYRWEHEAMLASKHFQDAVEPPSSFDIVVLILWSRLGTPLPERTVTREYHGIDGRVPVTGTEWEYEEALKTAREKGAPDILAFRNVSPAPVDTLNFEARARSNAQLDALDQFWRRHFADRGIFLAAYDEYRTLEAFAQRLEESLRKLIERRIKALDAGVSRDEPIWLGEPFRGLESYEFEHAPIFFGRNAGVTKATEQLAAAARSGRAFLLVSGASGSGKSSLVKAGVVPRLMKPQRISGAAFLRRCVFRPATEGGDLFLGLARVLTRASAQDMGLPELIASGQNAAQLATHLRGAAGEPSFPFVSALGRLTEIERKSGRLLAFEEAKLVLVVDQFEELFTVSGIRPEDRRLFVQLIAGLARSGAVWVIATLRADFWHRAAEIPQLITLAEAHGRIDLAAATAAELAEMIRKPAQAAGLTFELHPQAGIGLDAVLAQDAAAAPGALPLLSFTLDELYKTAKARGEDELTHASYGALGGLEGAIANRADQILGTLPAAAQAALPRVLRALTTVVGASDRLPVARSVSLGTFATGTPARVLIDAFIEQRLLVAGSESGAAPTVRLAHEALISRWRRARDQLSADRRDLETRSLVEREIARWNQAHGRERRLLLLRNPDLADAVDLVRRWGDEIDVETRNFIQISQQRARLKQRMAITAVAAFFLIAVGAGAAAFQAFRQQHLANEQRDRAVTTNSRLAARALSALNEGDAQTDILLSLEAMRPPDDVGPDHYESEAEKSLLIGMTLNPLRSILKAAGTKYSDAAFAYDGSILMAIGKDGAPSFWKVDAGAHAITKTQLTLTVGSLTALVANPARPIFLFRSEDGAFFAWNFERQQVVPSVAGTCSESSSGGLGAGRGAQFRFNITGERLFMFCKDVTIFDLDTGQVTRLPGSFDSFSVSPGGREFAVTKDKTVTVVDGMTGNVLTSWQQDDSIEGVAMSHDGKAVLTHNYQGIQFHDSRSGTLSQPPIRTSQARTFGLYTSAKESIFATYGDDGSKVWNAARAAPIRDVAGTLVGFLPDGTLVAATTQKITLWDYPTEGHTGTRFPVDRADLYLAQGHKFVTSSANGELVGHSHGRWRSIYLEHRARNATAGSDRRR
jgi:WD40 repeat protein